MEKNLATCTYIVFYVQIDSKNFFTKKNAQFILPSTVKLADV